MNALDVAISECGGVCALAEKLGVRQNVVSNWKMRESVPAARCLDIERITHSVVTRYQLRPDVFGEPQDIKAA
jgi:DNA-binding transcriptional regulator YdaS (Cro superfamily)